MLRLFCATTLFIAFLGSAYSQQPESKLPTCEYTELYRKEGWPIPGIEGAKKKWRVETPNKQGVYMTEMEPSTHTSTIQRLRCSREHASRLEIEEIHVGISGLWSFDVGGRIFAYGMVYGVDGIAAVTFVRFYDLDGSGRFTLIRGERNRSVPELIPDWVRNEIDAKGK